MATTLFIVKATIPPEKEAAFNRWYNEEHVPQVLQFPGLVSARRYKALEGEDKSRADAGAGRRPRSCRFT